MAPTDVSMQEGQVNRLIWGDRLWGLGGWGGGGGHAKREQTGGRPIRKATGVGRGRWKLPSWF